MKKSSFSILFVTVCLKNVFKFHHIKQLNFNESESSPQYVCLRQTLTWKLSEKIALIFSIVWVIISKVGRKSSLKLQAAQFYSPWIYNKTQKIVFWTLEKIKIMPEVRSNIIHHSYNEKKFVYRTNVIRWIKNSPCFCSIRFSFWIMTTSRLRLFTCNLRVHTFINVHHSVYSDWCFYQVINVCCWKKHFFSYKNV